MLKVDMRTVDWVKKKFIEEGSEASLERRLTSRIYERFVEVTDEQYPKAKQITLVMDNYVWMNRQSN